VTATFLREVRVELKKVTWPTRKEALASTLVVLVLTFISALYLFGIDGILRFVIKLMTGKAA
jgi:preprotein translocase subunit SecE